jgi:hypothetical protein
MRSGNGIHGVFLAAATVLGAAVAGCGGQTVVPLDPRDTSLPVETRRWIAAAEDGLMVARAGRDGARAGLDAAQRERSRLEETVDWGSGGADLERAMNDLSGAKVTLAALRLELAEAMLLLADAKYQLANAERAILHDLARYELEPIRAGVDDARTRVREAQERVRAQLDAVDAAATRFWTAYSAFLAKGGKAHPYWIGNAAPLKVAETRPGKPEEAKASAEAPDTGVGAGEIPQNPF